MGWVAPARDLEPVRPGRGRGDPFAGAAAGAKKGGERLVPLSVPEVRKLLLKLLWAAVPEDEEILAWSAWRRRHQHTARECHYRKRGARPPD